jgi:hypothetical protein
MRKNHDNEARVVRFARRLLPISSLSLVLLLSRHAWGDQPAQADGADKASASASEHAGAVVSLEFDKPEYFLGENILLRWRIRNAGDTPLKFSVGGDGRTPGAKRAIRFKVESYDEAGNPVPDPYPNPHNMGGFGGVGPLKPQEEHWEDLQLMRYREFTKPGKYTIQVYHDLGWEKRDSDSDYRYRDSSEIPPPPREAPVVTAEINLVMPNAAQAREVVDEMLSLPENSNRTWGEKGQPYADFELLRYPVYLPIVKELSESGDARGLDAIGAMAFPEATGALIELMDHNHPEISAKAGSLLFQRAPYIYDTPPSRRSYLVERSWTDELKKLAMEPTWELLEGSDRDRLIRGARLVQSLGGKEDLPALVEVMERVLVTFRDDDVEQRAYLRPATACETLTGASLQLLRRGAKPTGEPTTPGQAAVWLMALGSDENFRPDGWRETLRGLARHDIPCIRDAALKQLPLPLAEADIELVAMAIDDKFEPVQGAACELAGKVKSEKFRGPLTKALEATDNEWVMRNAFSAAAECGVENDWRLEICVRRMRPRDNDWNMLMLQLLKDGAIESHGHSARAIENWSSILPGLRKSWLDFIEAHRQLLRKGTRFPASDPPLSPAMFPPGYRIHRNGQPPWPEEP